MEYNNAIEAIEKHLAELYQHPDIYDSDDHRVIHALEEFALPAMLKEICRDVILKTSTLQFGREYYACPGCGEFIRWRHGCGITYYEQPVRCPLCGQSLNWEDLNEN